MIEMLLIILVVLQAYFTGYVWGFYNAKRSTIKAIDEAFKEFEEKHNAKT